MNKKIIWIIALFCLVASVNAELYYKQGTNISLKIPCNNQGTQCSQSTDCNLTAVKNIDGSYLVNNDGTDRLNNGDFQYNISFADYGDYTIKLYCSDGYNNITSIFSAKVTESGIEATTSQGIIYVFSMLIVFIISITLVGAAVTIEGRNTSNADGSGMQLNKKKYAKVLCGTLGYVSFWIFSFLAQEMAEYLNLGTVFTLFETIFVVMSILLIPAVIVAAWIGVLMLIEDKKIDKLMKRGVSQR